MNQLRYCYNSSNEQVVYKWILFIISPLLGLVYSIRNLNTKSSRVIFSLFCLFFGLAFTVSDVRTEGSPDGVSYRLLFESYVGLGEVQYVWKVQDFLTFSGSVKDIYVDTVAYVVSRFTDNYHIFFMVIAIVFACFQLKTLKYQTKSKNYSYNIVCLFLLFLFTFVSIKNINGLRFWTAYWVTCLCLFKLILDKKYHYFILIALLPTIHASYVTVWILLGIYYLSARFSRLWTILLILSLFLGNLSLSLIQENAYYAPDFLSRFVDYYASEKTVEKINAVGSGFYMLDRIFPIIVNVYLNIMLLMINRSRDKIKQYSTKNLLAFTVIVVSFSNFVMPIPSLGKRFMILSYPLIAYLWLNVFGVYKYKRYVYLMPIVFFMSIYHLLESYISNVDPLFYITSPIIDFFLYI